MTRIAVLHLLISGRVQGVGFRYATAREAGVHGLAGWVRNRSDGTVEAEFAGPDSALQEMLSWCHQGPRLARVDSVQATWRDTELPYPPGFIVR